MLTTLTDAESQILEFGLEPKIIELDGRYHRCQYQGEKRSRMSGFYKLREIARDDEILVDGIFGSFKVSDRPFVTERRVSLGIEKKRYEQIKKEVQERRFLQIELERQKHEEAEIRADFIWESASENGKSSYLENKKVGAFGVRFHGSVMIIPMVREGRLRSLQSIMSNGKKKYMPGGNAKGAYHIMPGSNRVALCEGYSTGASIHMATGWTVAVCFSTTGLISAGPYFKKKDVVICADNDRETELNIGKNPGLEAAKKTAQKIECPVLVPESEEVRFTDFNDIHVNYGLDEVRLQCSKI